MQVEEKYPHRAGIEDLSADELQGVGLTSGKQLRRPRF